MGEYYEPNIDKILTLHGPKTSKLSKRWLNNIRSWWNKKHEMVEEITMLVPANMKISDNIKAHATSIGIKIINRKDKMLTLPINNFLTDTDKLILEKRIDIKSKEVPWKGGNMSFKSVQKKIAAKQGISNERAGAVLAESSRNASAAAKRKNPKLKRVKG